MITRCYPGTRPPPVWGVKFSEVGNQMMTAAEQMMSAMKYDWAPDFVRGTDDILCYFATMHCAHTLRHVTINTGHVSETTREGIPEENVEKLYPIVAAAEKGGVLVQVLGPIGVAFEDYYADQVVFYLTYNNRAVIQCTLTPGAVAELAVEFGDGVDDIPEDMARRMGAIERDLAWTVLDRKRL